ncbi:hypothetical protein Rs2_03983 [Raphanus sativus]|uniref:Uncharacterized protein LOC108831074 n=1 Tax=Raphanus sativus TaxID=3726 RepID=A0A6J0LIR7_RAPSA|nr:uncharacterized protein LOC108831074 [Raphanus sativus]KAJ4909362.1 hypothetical protein Rs2_03983 [Raphanus sativus]
MRRFLQRFPSLAARSLINPPTILRHPKIINPRVVVPSLLNRVTSRFAFFSSEPNSVRGSGSSEEVVSKEELKKRIQSFLEDGDEDALPDLFEAMMKRKLSGKHDESDDEVMEEVRKYPINDDARKSDGGDSSDSDVESDDDLSDGDSSDSDVEIDDLKEDSSDWSDDSDVEIDGGDSPDSDIEFDGLKDVDLSGRGIKFNDGLKDVDLPGRGIKLNVPKDGDLSGPGIEINGPKDGNLSGFDVKIDALKPDHSSYSDSESD